MRVPDQRLDLAVDILSDIVWSPALRPDDVESERQVILEEIRIHDDTPDDLVHEVFATAMFPEHPIGREVIGSSGDQWGRSPHRHDGRAVHAQHYHPQQRGGHGGREPRARGPWFALVEKQAPRRSGASGLCGRRTRATPQPIPIVSDRRRAGAGAPRAREDAGAATATILIGLRVSVCSTRSWAAGWSSACSKRCVSNAGLPTRCTRTARPSRRPAHWASTRAPPPERVERGLASACSKPRSTASSSTAASATTGLNAAKGHLTGSLALSLETSISRMNRIGRSELLLW